ncbi:MAG TPA: PQQ-binding-like beta-propeller repeat protein [Bryobacteraceae bacterium]|nr:PQQ-binding-like beta-propeller repeat protein [Bryobacteraceae bacterium]
MALCQSMFRGGPDHTGVYQSSGLRQPPAVKWRFQTQGPVLSSPAVDAGTVYFGSSDQDFYAVDQTTGALQWKFHTESAIASSPAVANGLVYFGSFDGAFYALDAARGTLKWKFETEGERRFSHRHLHGLQPYAEVMPDPWDFWMSSPAVSNGIVYFGSGDHHVYALDAATGALRWKGETGDVVHSSPAIAGGNLIIGSWDSFVYAMDAATFKFKWRFQGGLDPQTGNQQGFQASPAVANGVVYIGCRDSNVYALDLATGEKKWAFNNQGSWVLNSAAVYDGKVYFGTSDSGLFHELDAATGAKLFTIDGKFPYYASPAIANGALFLGTFGGRLLAYDLKTHAPLWAFQTEASKKNAPAFSKPDGSIDFSKLISFPFYDDMVLAVHKMYTAGAFLSSPAIAGNTLFIGSADGAVYAFE